jgi:hypothetical protein
MYAQAMANRPELLTVSVTMAGLARNPGTRNAVGEEKGR